MAKHPLEGQLIFPDVWFLDGSILGNGDLEVNGNALAREGYPKVSPFFWSGDGSDEGYIRYPSPTWPTYTVTDKSPKPDDYYYQLEYDVVGIKKLCFLLNKIRVTGTYKRHGWKWVPIVPTPPPGYAQSVFQQFTATWTINQLYDIGNMYYSAQNNYVARPMGQLRYYQTGYGTWPYSFYVCSTPSITSDDDPNESLSLYLYLFQSDPYSLLYQRSTGKLYPRIWCKIGNFYTISDYWCTDHETEDDALGDENTLWDADHYTYDSLDAPFLSNLVSGQTIKMRTWNKNGPQVSSGNEWWSELIDFQINAEEIGNWSDDMVNQIDRQV